MLNDYNAGLSMAGTSFPSNANPSYNLFNNLQVKTIDPTTQNVKDTNCN